MAGGWMDMGCAAVVGGNGTENRRGRPVFPHSDGFSSADQGDEEQDEEDEEADLRDTGSGSGETGESENTGDEGDDDEGEGPGEHGFVIGCVLCRPPVFLEHPVAVGLDSSLHSRCQDSESRL